MESGITVDSKKAFNLVWKKDSTRKAAKDFVFDLYVNEFMSGGEGGDADYIRAKIDGVIDAHKGDKTGDPSIVDLNKLFCEEEERLGKAVACSRG
jgi:hypothetical protein